MLYNGERVAPGSGHHRLERYSTVGYRHTTDSHAGGGRSEDGYAGGRSCGGRGLAPSAPAHLAFDARIPHVPAVFVRAPERLQPVPGRGHQSIG
jgi:hypothetical protein